MTHDIRAEQAEGAGGLEIKRAVKKNPVAVWGYPKWLQNIADLFPIVPSMGAPLQTALICDDMSSMKFAHTLLVSTLTSVGDVNGGIPQVVELRKALRKEERVRRVL